MRWRFWKRDKPVPIDALPWFYAMGPAGNQYIRAESVQKASEAYQLYYDQEAETILELGEIV